MKSNAKKCEKQLTAIPRLENSVTRQARNYLQLIGQTIGSQKIEGVKFFFSSKPPQEIIDALEALGVIVKWT